MEENVEKTIPRARKIDSTELLERLYLDVCLSEEEEELSDWSEEDLSLHFSASVINPSESESEPETGLQPQTGLRPQTGLYPEVQDQDKSQIHLSPDPYLDLPLNRPRPKPQQPEQPRPQLFLRQHSLPESGGGAYRGMIAGLQTQAPRRLQKSFSLDETRTKMALCVIKTVLSKKMQEQDLQVPPNPTKTWSKPKEDPGPTKTSETSKSTEIPGFWKTISRVRTSSRPGPRPHPISGSKVHSTSPSRGHVIKLAASLRQPHLRTETFQPITAGIHLDSSDVITSQSQSRSEEVSSRDPHQTKPSAQEQSSFLGLKRSALDPPWFSSRDLQIKISCASPSVLEEASSRGSSQTNVNPPWVSSRDPRLPSVTVQKQASSLVHNQPFPPCFSSSRDPHQPSLSAQDQGSSLGHRRSAVDPPWFSSRDPHHPSAPAKSQGSSQGFDSLVLPWFSSHPGSVGGVGDRQDFVETPCHVSPAESGLQRKTLLDPETGQFVQVLLPVSGPVPLLPNPAPSFLSLGYSPNVLPLAPKPTLLVPVQPTVFTQPYFILSPVQLWIYYRPG